MDKTPEISIIVPIYNVDNYLKHSLDSIMNQTFKDWECILVDDGSKDDSGKICDEYAALDSRFRVVHRKNGGVSAARNTGISEARAPFIGFVDPDDWADPEYLQTLYHLITEHKADVAQVGYYIDYTSFSRPKHLVKEIVEFNRKEIAEDLLFGKHIPSYLWNKIFRREVLTIKFPEGRNFEDIYVMHEWARNMHKMVLAPDLLYHYRKREGSIINSNYAKNRLDFLSANIQRVQTLNAIEPEIFTTHKMSYYLWEAAVNAGKIIARFEKDKEIRETAIKQISDRTNSFPLPSLKELGPKLYLRAKSLSNNPKIFSVQMRIALMIDFQTRNRRKELFD